MLSILQSASAVSRIFHFVNIITLETDLTVKLQAATRRFVTNVPGRVLTRCRHETGGFPHFAATSLSVDNARR